MQASGLKLADSVQGSRAFQGFRISASMIDVPSDHAHLGACNQDSSEQRTPKGANANVTLKGLPCGTFRAVRRARTISTTYFDIYTGN